MKKLLALLGLLLLGPVMAQEVQQVIPGPYIPPPLETGNIIYTTLNPPPEGSQYTWNGFISLNTGGGGLQGGNIPAYNSLTGTFIWGYVQRTVTYNFFGNNDWPSSGIEVDGFKYSWEYFNQDFSRGTLSANISIFGPNNNLLESYNFGLPQTTPNGWTVYSGQIDFANPYDRAELGRLQLSFTGKDDRFWLGYYGPQVRDLDVSILYHTPGPPPPIFPYWSIIAGEWGTFTITEPSTVRYGGEGVYLYAEFQPGTYACNNFEWGKDPIGGVQKSCEVGTLVDPNPPQTDCSLYPTDPNCAVLVYTDPDLIADQIVDDIVADVLDTTDDTNIGSDDGSDDGTEVVDEEEETVVADNTTDETTVDDNIDDSKDEEETVVIETTTTALATVESQATYRELTDEEKAQILADSIAKNTLEMALSIAENASSNNASAATTETTTSTSRATVTSTIETTETTVVDNKTENEQQKDNSNDTATDLLETGRSLNAVSMAATQQQTEQSASDSITQAESIAIGSAESKINDIVIENVIASTVDTSSNNTITNTNDGSDITVEQKTVETIIEETVANNIEQNTDTSNQTIDSFGDIMNLVIAATTETKDEDVEFVQSILAQTEQKKDETANTFEDDEKVTIQNDPNLANAFNVAPNTTNLEILGVLSNKQEEKSDAEKKAEQVVAANKEQQEEINKNYMDADQSGIVAAIGADTDVTSYRSVMLNDNNIWYKPEDIYKNVVYKDNVRGAYFLEKGNTDTYKKMVEEQYK